MNTAFGHPHILEFGDPAFGCVDFIFRMRNETIKLSDLIKDNRDLKTQVELLTDANEQLEEKFNKLSEIMTQIYYSPNNPGYVQARQNFTEKLKNQQTT